MRQFKTALLVATSVLAVSACQKSDENEVDKALKNVNVIDESNLNDIMLTVAIQTKQFPISNEVLKTILNDLIYKEGSLPH